MVIRSKDLIKKLQVNPDAVVCLVDRDGHTTSDITNVRVYKNKSGARIYLGNHNITTAAELPSNPEAVLRFIGSNFWKSDTSAENMEDWHVTLSIHDLLSSFAEWKEQGDCGLPLILDLKNLGKRYD